MNILTSFVHRATRLTQPPSQNQDGDTSTELDLLQARGLDTICAKLEALRYIEPQQVFNEAQKLHQVPSVCLPEYSEFGWYMGKLGIYPSLMDAVLQVVDFPECSRFDTIKGWATAAKEPFEHVAVQYDYTRTDSSHCRTVIYHIARLADQKYALYYYADRIKSWNK